MISVAVLNAERDVLSAMLCPDADLDQARAILKPEQFDQRPNRLVFEAIIACHQAGNPISLVNLVQELEQRGELAQANGAQGIASLLSIATSGANLKSHARILIAHYARRITRRLADEFVQSLDDPTLEVGETISQIMGRLGSAQYQAVPEAAIERVMAQIMTERQLMETVLPPIDPIIGDRICAKGGITVMGGMPGAGKTFLAHQAVRAVAAGGSWIGFQCQKGRAALIELEMPAVALQDRTRPDLNGCGGSEDVDVLAMPQGLGFITDNRTQEILIHVCLQRSLALLVLDPWNQMHGGDVTRDMDMGPAMAGLRRICNATGVAILFIHHLNKMQFDKGMDPMTAVILAMKGAGAMCDRADTVLGLGRTQGRSRLVFAKVRLATSAPPEFVDLKRTASGFFERTETPAEVSDLTDEKITKCLTFYGSQGALAGEVCKTTRMARATFYRHADRMGLVVIGKRYFLPLYAPEETRRMEGI